MFPQKYAHISEHNNYIIQIIHVNVQLSNARAGDVDSNQALIICAVFENEMIALGL